MSTHNIRFRELEKYIPDTHLPSKFITKLIYPTNSSRKHAYIILTPLTPPPPPPTTHTLI